MFIFQKDKINSRAMAPSALFYDAPVGSACFRSVFQSRPEKLNFVLVPCGSLRLRWQLLLCWSIALRSWCS
ncbi:hypothetical protein L596_024705 [Steinernema carpocapsae]|uniref:Uncharacterized protein n=1 Tax=Steinernema carpocapsae TaxID=34508 RepID=A0A4U5M5I1_STECR|nr:hypothetical protein L596_024705 [Steinernema carpocapsae]